MLFIPNSRTAISIAHGLARGARGRAESEGKAGGARDVRREHCAGGREGREDRPSRGVVSRSTPHRARGMAPGLTDANVCALLDGIPQHAREVIEDAGRRHEAPGPPGGYGLPCRPVPGAVHDRPGHPRPPLICRRPAQFLPPPTQQSVLSLRHVGKCHTFRGIQTLTLVLSHDGRGDRNLSIDGRGDRNLSIRRERG